MDFHLEHFDGPLDLLLHLIAKNKVNIYDIPIADILEQYMEVLHSAQELDMDVAGDFIAMAAQLIYIKSRMLLPKPPAAEEEDDPRAGLVEQLLEYQRIKEALPYLRAQGERGRNVFVKGPEPLPAVRPEYHQSVQDLIHAADNLLNKKQRSVPPPVSAFRGIVGREPVPVEGQIQAIVKRLRAGGRLRFLCLFEDASGRSEIVATFLAVLELSKLHQIELIGDGKEIELNLIPESSQEIINTAPKKTQEDTTKETQAAPSVV